MPEVLAVLTDLFFLVQINDIAKRKGHTVRLVKDRDEEIGNPAFVILDLNCASLDPLNIIRRIKSNPATAHIRTIAFVPHVQTELKQQSEAAGCDFVLARSVFAQKLPALLNNPSSG